MRDFRALQIILLTAALVLGLLAPAFNGMSLLALALVGAAAAPLFLRRRIQ